ncbi:MAG TPA: hypothetical protein VN903_15325 [Polyangia bacterium]|nr:hypothetical protein [Polyangia bacterium]
MNQVVAIAAMLAAAPLPVSVAEPPPPPLIPGGVADVNGALGFFAVNDGSIVAVDLATGKPRWTTRLGRWPLTSRAGWLAVAAPDGAQRNTLHIRFLRSADGKLIVDAPVRFPDGVVVSDDGDAVDGEVVVSAHNASLTLSSDTEGGRLRVSWVAQSWIPSGFRPSPVQKVSGVVLVDPAKASVQHRPRPEVAAPPPTPLPAGFKPVAGTLYWSWTRYGAAWSDRPRTFSISPGVTAFFSYESRPARRLLLNRWQNDSPLPPLEIASGGEYAPLVSPDGHHLVLTSGTAERPIITLYDLTRAGGNPLPVPARLPPLGMRFRPPFAVIGPRLYFVAEGDGTMTGPNYGTVFLRQLVALDWASGRVSWLHPLTPRILPAPTPGGGAAR